MKYVALRVFLILFYLIIMPGCGRLVDWGKDTFYQGESLPINTVVAQRNVRSIAVYDQFTTCAIFDALLLSDDVRTAYADIYMRKLGSNQDKYNAFLRRQLEENKHYLSFYVLSLYEKPLGEATSEWMMFLRIDGVDMVPFEVKSVDISSEYQLLFGKRFNRFKVAYSVKFPIRDRDGNFLINPQAQKIALVFRSMDKETLLTWDMSSRLCCDACN